MAQFGAPNFLSVIDAYEAGSRRAERNRLAELDNLGRQLQGQALSGDQNALARLGEVNPQAYMQTKQFTQQEKAARLDELAAGAMAADTPEKWQAFVQRAAAQGHRLDPGETRESILDQAMGWKEKLAQSNTDRQFNASQSNANRSYDLQVRGFNADEAYRRQQIALERQKLNQPDLTTDMKEYNLAKSQGYTGSFFDFQKEMKAAGASRTNIDTGTVPQGYQAVRDDQGRVVRYDPVPGGPADTSASNAVKAENQSTATDVIMNAASNIRRLAKSPGSTGLAGAGLSYNPATDAAEIYRQVEVLRSNAKVENLQAMRAASPTGGALGSVTEKENEMLAAKAGAIDPKSPYFMQQVDDYERTLLRIIHGKKVGDAIFEQSRDDGANDPLGIR